VSEQRRRILLVIDEASVGGGQRHVLALASRLDARDFVAGVACEAEGYLVDELRKRGIPHFSVAMSNVPDPHSIYQCIGAIRRFRADVVHTHGGTAGVTGRIAAFLTGVPAIHTYHGIHYLHDTGLFRRWAYTAVERALLKVTRKIICVAQKDSDTGKRAGIVDPRKTVVIVNGIEISEFSGEGPSHPREVPVIGTIGRLHQQKGHAILLESLAILAKNGQVFRCRIIGEGELRAHLEDQAATLGLNEAVEFVGGRTDSAAQLSAFDIFVLPSLWEGLPIVLIEAMASGLCIVASRVDGVEEAVTDEREALLVPPGDPVRLAESLSRVLGNAALRRDLGLAARRRALEAFHVKAMVTSTESVYRSVLL
jgi:glycosyltransferase involved in cell wall biosynthesis